MELSEKVPRGNASREFQSYASKISNIWQSKLCKMIEIFDMVDIAKLGGVTYELLAPFETDHAKYNQQPC